MKKYVLLILLLISEVAVFAQNVNITGIVKNSTDSVIVFYKIRFDAITRKMDGTRHKAVLNKNGEFEISLPQQGISLWALRVGEKYRALLDFCDGNDLNLIIDIKNVEGQVVAMGANSPDINFQSYMEKQVEKNYSSEFYKKLNSLTLQEALKLRKEKSDFQLATLEAYNKDSKLSDKYYNWLKTFYKYEPYERTLFEHLRTNELRTDSNYISLLTENGLNDNYAAKNSSDYNDLVNYYMWYKYYKFNNLMFPVKTTDLFEFGTKNNLTGLTKQVFLTRQMMTIIKSKDSLYDAMFQKFKKEVSDKELLQRIIDERNIYLTQVAESNRSKENISQSAALSEIFQKYKGKVVYLDFWASWCAPCKSEMPNSNALKVKLAGKDVVFLYFGYQDQKENWLAARKELEIEGEHVLLSPNLIKEAGELFKISGIPHYAIIDKDGTILNKSALRPSYVYDELLKLADKK